LTRAGSANTGSEIEAAVFAGACCSTNAERALVNEKKGRDFEPRRDTGWQAHQDGPACCPFVFLAGDAGGAGNRGLRGQAQIRSALCDGRPGRPMTRVLGLTGVRDKGRGRAMNRRNWGGNQQAMAAILTGGMPATIDEVLVKLADLQAVMDRLDDGPGNPVARFNFLYHTITQEIKNRLAGGFEDPAFMEILDVQFANLYLGALTEWTNGKADVRQCWRLLFERWDDSEVTPILGAILGVNAHVQCDLANAVLVSYQQIDSPPVNDSPRHRDYLVINDIFEAQIPVLRRELTAGNSIQHALDVASGILDDIVQSQILTQARELAWESAGKLWDVRNEQQRFDEEINGLDENAAQSARLLLSTFANPLGSWLLGPRTRLWG
jgi:hypothetical protein